MKYIARENRKHQNTLSINASIDGNCPNDFTEFLHSNKNLEVDYLEHERILEIQMVVSELEPDEFELVFFVYYNNFPLTDYAAKKGVSYSKIVRKKNYILASLDPCLYKIKKKNHIELCDSSFWLCNLIFIKLYH